MSQSYASAGLPFGLPWKDDWSPSYANITVGNGVVVARYVGEPGQLVVAQWMLTFGSTTTIGSNNTISLPVNASTLFAAEKLNMGSAMMLEDGTDRHQGIVERESSTTCQVRTLDAGSAVLKSGNLTASVPFTWGEFDSLSFEITYEGVS